METSNHILFLEIRMNITNSMQSHSMFFKKRKYNKLCCYEYISNTT